MDSTKKVEIKTGETVKKGIAPVQTYDLLACSPHVQLKGCTVFFFPFFLCKKITYILDKLFRQITKLLFELA